MRHELRSLWSRLVCLVVGHDRQEVEWTGVVRVMIPRVQVRECVMGCRRPGCRLRFWVEEARHG